MNDEAINAEEDRAWVDTKADLAAHIGRDWAALNALLDTFTDAQWTGLTDHAGWTVKDHVAHLTAWEQSINALLRKQPRHEGIGLPEDLFKSGDVDAVNAALWAKHRHDPLAEVRARFHAAHADLLALLAPLTDEDLNRPLKEHLPNSAKDYPVIDPVYGSTAFHYREHTEWLARLLPK